MNEIMSNHQNEPYVIVVHTPEQLLLVIEKEVIAEINDVEEVLFTLLSSFFVFNSCYPFGCTNFYLFC